MKKKKIICIAAACAVAFAALSGCKGGNTAAGESAAPEDAGGGVKGRFVEEELTLPQEAGDPRALRITDSGSLEVVARNREEKAYYLLTSGDMGESWETVAVQGLTEEYYPRIAIAPDGTAAFVPYTKGGIAAVKVSDPQGATTDLPVELPQADSEENYIFQAEYDDGGNLILLDMNGTLLKVDPDSGTYSTPFDTQGAGINYFGIVGDRCFAVHDNGLFVFDTATGERGESVKAVEDMLKQDRGLLSSDSDEGQPMRFAAGASENSIMFVNYQGIFCMAEGGSVAEQLMDSGLTSFGMQGKVFYGAAMADAENIFVCTGERQGVQLLRCRYNEDASAAPGEELTVYALDESNMLRQAVTVFQKEHPDIYVNLEIGMSGDDGVTVEDALSVLNTNMLAGNGPDVLILDGMPLDSYIAKGILADISDVVAEVEEQDGIFENIRAGSETDGHIYAIPVSFMIPMAEGDADTVKAAAALDTLADRAEELQKQNPDEDVVSVKARSLLRYLYYADSATWKQQDGSLSEDALRDYLTAAKRIYDANRRDSDHLREDVGDGTFQGEKISTIGAEGIIMGAEQFNLGTLGEAQSFQALRSAEGQTGTSTAILNGGEVRSYVPYLLAGVTAGDREEAGKEFVKTLLGAEVGATADGIPLNRAAFARQIEKTEELVENEVSMGFTSSDGDSVYGFAYVNLTGEDVKTLTGWVESLERPALTDRVVQNLILEQGEKYLQGEQDLESALGAIMQKVGLYLAE